jgi:hypothetical protein
MPQSRNTTTRFALLALDVDVKPPLPGDDGGRQFRQDSLSISTAHLSGTYRWRVK